jgi:tRNA(Arg) A34 adenosine deaminase TadA
MVKLSGYQSFTEEEELFMREAFLEAELALSLGEVPVGCVLTCVLANS